MSRVYIYTIDDDNLFESVGEAPNAWNFHVAIWSALGIEHHGWRRDDWSWFSARDGKWLDRLWADIGKLPRAHGLAMAATFDRCWFPWSLLGETRAALEAMTPRAAAAGVAARIMGDWREERRGFTFASSLASAWSCGGDYDDPWHHVVRFDRNEHSCSRCKKDDIENASEIVRTA